MNTAWFQQLREYKHSGAYRSVGLALAIRAKEDRPTCWPSITTLCRDASVCRLTVVRATSLFQIQGLLQIEKRKGRANVYCLIVKKRLGICSRPQRQDQCITETGHPATPETGSQPNTRLPQRQDPATPETRKESSLKAPKQEGVVGAPNQSEVPY